MPRKPRTSLVAPGLPNHVIVRGNNRRRLFSYSSDYQRYLRCLVESPYRDQNAIHQLSMMANHVHLIITPNSVEALSEFVGRANHRYAQARNAARDASGKLFEQRFRSDAIVTSEQLAVTTAYNDANFYRIRPEKGPLEHRWSTVRLHAGEPIVEPLIRELWTPSAWYVGLGESTGARSERYREYLASYLELGSLPGAIPNRRGVAGPERRYTRRLERPNRSRAREPAATYRGKLRG